MLMRMSRKFTGNMRTLLTLLVISICRSSLPNAVKLNDAFCFFQTEYGSIPAVQYNRNETADMINFKSIWLLPFGLTLGTHLRK